MSEDRASRKRVVGELLMAAAFLALAGLVFQQTRTAFVAAGAASGGAMQNAAMYPEFLAAGLVGTGAPADRAGPCGPGGSRWHRRRPAMRPRSRRPSGAAI